MWNRTGAVPEHVSHEDEAQERRGHEVGRLVDGEDGVTVNDDDGCWGQKRGAGQILARVPITIRDGFFFCCVRVCLKAATYGCSASQASPRA